MILVSKSVPPGSATVPGPIMLIAGDTLTVSVSTFGDVLEAHWESTFVAQMNMTIEFDYMEIKDAGAVRGTIFTEVAHSELGREGA